MKYRQEERKILFKSSSSHRKDLTTEFRIKIASIALFFSIHGTVTKLSQKYNISRRFVYDLKESLEYHCHIEDKQIELTHKETLLKSYEKCLLLRMDGNCSINSISTIMKHFGLPYASVGSVSEQLKLAGGTLDNVFDKKDSVTYAIFASDEIYAKQRPILITCDPVSFVIFHIKLCESCTSTQWVEQWEQLKKSGVLPLYLTKDEGVQMECAAKDCYDQVDIQSDTYHGVAHKLGLWNKRLQRFALNKIENEYEKERLLLNSKTEKTKIKRELQYEQAKIETNKSLDILSDFEFIYYNLLSCFECIDSNGKLKNKEQVVAKFEEMLELGIQCIDHEDIVKRLKSIQKIKNKLFYFYDIAKNTLQKLNTETDSLVLKFISLYWQINKRLIKTKDNNRARKIQNHLNEILSDIKELTGDQFEIVFYNILKELDNIVQSSSAIECVNSILRPYLNTCKNQPTQEFLNLFMFYHNHRRFKAGKRKGKTPMELFTSEQQNQTWLELLMVKINNKI